MNVGIKFLILLLLIVCNWLSDIYCLLCQFVDIDVTVLSDSLYSYQHLKAFGNANHLYLDPWNSNTVWSTSSSWIIQRVSLEVLVV